MPRSWKDTSVWKRGVAIFAILLVCSLGLCAANLSSFQFFGLAFSGSSHGRLKDTASVILTWTAGLEIVGMVVGAIGLLISLAGLLISWAMRNKKSEGS